MYKISIANSINRILKTPLGSRVMRPEFGSRLYELRDKEFNDEFKLDATRFTYEALSKNEPRIKVERVVCEIEPVGGKVVLKIYLQNGVSVEVAI